MILQYSFHPVIIFSSGMFAFIIGNISGFLGLFEVVNGSNFSFEICYHLQLHSHCTWNKLIVNFTDKSHCTLLTATNFILISDNLFMHTYSSTYEYSWVLIALIFQ